MNHGNIAPRTRPSNHSAGAVRSRDREPGLSANAGSTGYAFGYLALEHFHQFVSAGGLLALAHPSTPPPVRRPVLA